jgi:hypothetical protein
VRLTDFTKNGKPELVVGTPGENPPGESSESGGIWGPQGTATGPTTTGSYSVMAQAVGLSGSYINWSSIQSS